MLALSSTVSRGGDLLQAQVGEELVMMSIDAGAYFGLAEVGKRIWELIERPTTVADLCARLTDEYDVPREICETETLSFLRELQGHGIINVVAP